MEPNATETQTRWIRGVLRADACLPDATGPVVLTRAVLMRAEAVKPESGPPQQVTELRGADAFDVLVTPSGRVSQGEITRVRVSSVHVDQPRWRRLGSGIGRVHGPAWLRYELPVHVAPIALPQVGSGAEHGVPSHDVSAGEAGRASDRPALDDADTRRDAAPLEAGAVPVERSHALERLQEAEKAGSPNAGMDVHAPLAPSRVSGREVPWQSVVGAATDNAEGRRHGTTVNSNAPRLADPDGPCPHGATSGPFNLVAAPSVDAFGSGRRDPSDHPGRRGAVFVAPNSVPEPRTANKRRGAVGPLARDRGSSMSGGARDAGAALLRPSLIRPPSSWTTVASSQPREPSQGGLSSAAWHAAVPVLTAVLAALLRALHWLLLLLLVVVVLTAFALLLLHPCIGLALLLASGSASRGRSGRS